VKAGHLVLRLLRDEKALKPNMQMRLSPLATIIEWGDVAGCDAGADSGASRLQ
jgi:hypothetical protein